MMKKIIALFASVVVFGSAFAQTPATPNSSTSTATAPTILKESTPEEVMKAFSEGGTFVRENVLGKFILVTVLTDGMTFEHAVPGLRRCTIYEFNSTRWIYVGDPDYAKNGKTKAQAYMESYLECAGYTDSYLVTKVPANRKGNSKSK